MLLREVCWRLRDLEPLTNQLNGFGQCAWTEAEGALDQARLARSKIAA
jgi:hypothetical protein